MEGLRSTLSVVSLVLGIAWIALAILGATFRASFGASAKAGFAVIFPPVLFFSVAAGVMLPDHRWFLHVVSGLVAIAVVACIVIIREAPIIAALGLLYAFGWFNFYRLALSAGAE